MFRLRFSGGGELVLTEGGRKKRAGVWLATPEQVEADLAHLGPDALEVDTAMLAEILKRDRRQLHPLLRDQRAIAGIGRAHANEILLRARLSPFKASTELTPEETERLATTIHENLEHALELRLRGKGDKDVYVIHNRLGEPCPQCGTPIARVDFEEHTIYYCPTCQTGGRVLEGPPTLETAPGSVAGRDRHQAGRGSPGVVAGGRARALTRGCDRTPEGRAHPAWRRGDGHGGDHRLHRRPRGRPEGRAHVALPRALRGGDRARRRARGDARRGARRANREPGGRAAGGAPGRGLDPRSVADQPPNSCDEPEDAGDGDALRHRRGFRSGNATSGRRRGDGHQRVPVRAGARPQPRERATARGGLRLRRHRARSSSSSRSRPTTSAAAGRSSSEASRTSTRRCSSTSSSAR